MEQLDRAQVVVEELNEDLDTTIQVADLLDVLARHGWHLAPDTQGEAADAYMTSVAGG